MAKPLLAVNLRHILLRLLPSPELKLAGQQLHVSNHLDMTGDILWAINGVIMEANLRAAKEPEVKMWLRDVTAVVVDFENVLEVIQDSFQQPKEQKQEVTSSPILSNRGSISSTHHVIVNLKQIAASLNCLLSRMIAFGLQIVTIDSVDPNQAEYYSILQQEVVGRDDDVKRILQIIFQSQHGQTLEAIYGDVPFFTAITGEPGIGKSILARMVYHHPIVCKVFKYRIWVDVLNSTTLSFDHRQIARECVKQLTGRISSDIDIWNLLRMSLPQTRFLLVLDGFSSITKVNEDKLVELKRNLLSFDLDALGNKVIITCHSNPTMKSEPMAYLDKEYKLEILSHDAWTKLFLRYAIPRTQFDQAKHNSFFTRMQDLQNLANELHRKKLYRVPFEAKKLGSISRHTALNYYEFQKAHPKYNKQMTVHYSTREFAQIILYVVLFQQLPFIFHNHCFDMLFAEGTFNYTSNSQQQFQDVVTWINQFHETREVFDDLSFYVIKSIYHFRKRDDQEFRIPQECRYACILVDSNTSTFLTNLEPKFANKLRMLILYKDEMDFQLENDQEASSIKIPNSLFKNLIILSIIDTCIQQLPNTVSMLLRLRYLNISEKEMEELPESIYDLYNLRVLSLSHCKKLLRLPEQIHRLTKLQILRLSYCTRLQKVPKSISSLVNLQILDIKACHWLKELPEDLRYLERLTSLNMIGCASLTRVPFENFKLTNIEDLSGYMVDDCNPDSALKELQSLKNIVQLHIRHLERIKDINIFQSLNLAKKQYLENLVLHWELWNVAELKDAQCDPLVALENLQPNVSHLKSLEIISYFGFQFPNWMRIYHQPYLFKSLVEIRLINLKRCENLPFLCGLSFVAILEISGMDSLDVVEFTIFPKLLKLTLSEMPILEELNFICPSLQQLTLIQCPRLKELFGLEFTNKLNIWLQSEILMQYSFLFHRIFKNITELEIIGCNEMKQLPKDIKKCKHLRILSIVRCGKLLSMPDWLQKIPSLQQIFLEGCTKISHIPEELKQRLKDNIIVQGCSKLQTLTRREKHVK